MKSHYSSIKSRGCLLPILFLFAICGSTLADSKANWYYQNCPTHQQMTLSDNINAIAAILDAQSGWIPGSYFQDAMTAYLGPDSSSNAGVLWSYLEIIQAQFKQLRAGFKQQISVDPYKAYDLYIYCSVADWIPSPCGQSSNVISASWSNYKWAWGKADWYYYWVAICPGFWERPDLKTILAQTDKYAQSDPRVQDMNTYFPTKTSYLMAAIDSLDAFSVPKASFKSVTPWDTYQGVIKGGTGWAYRNSFSYVFAATAIFIKRRYSLVNPPIPSKPGPLVIANDPAITPQLLNVTSIPTLGLPTVSGGLPNPSYWISLPPGNGAAYESIIYSSNQTVQASTVPSSTVPPVHHPMVTTFVISITTTLSPDCYFTSAVTEIDVGDTAPDTITLPWCACSPNEDPAEGVGGYWAQSTDSHCTEATKEVPSLFTTTTEVETITSTISS